MGCLRIVPSTIMYVIIKCFTLITTKANIQMHLLPVEILCCSVNYHLCNCKRCCSSWTGRISHIQHCTAKYFSFYNIFVVKGEVKNYRRGIHSFSALPSLPNTCDITPAKLGSIISCITKGLELGGWVEGDSLFWIPSRSSGIIFCASLKNARLLKSIQSSFNDRRKFLSPNFQKLGLSRISMTSRSLKSKKR
jgi:hypothetical protein